jgi:hypothetical protein
VRDGDGSVAVVAGAQEGTGKVGRGVVTRPATATTTSPVLARSTTATTEVTGTTTATTRLVRRRPTTGTTNT